MSAEIPAGRERIRILEEELLAVVDRGDPKEVEQYFLVEQPTPFQLELRLRPDVDVEMAEEGFLGSLGLATANALARRARERRYRRQRAAHPDWKRVVAEGDSWFQHPLVADTIDHISGHVAVRCLSAAGDVLTEMFRGAEYRAAIEEERPAVFMLSAGGNDLMGGQFGDYLKRAPQASNDPARFLNERFHAKLDNLLQIYAAIFRELQAPNFGPLRVLCHGYDYVQPRAGAAGRWLGRPLEDKGIKDPADQHAVVARMIDLFNEGLRALAQGFPNVRYVDLRGVVQAGQWSDEIHPDSDGFQQVALRFLAHM
jgi:lysophospholipase L1-like esterase